MFISYLDFVLTAIILVQFLIVVWQAVNSRKINNLSGKTEKTAADCRNISKDSSKVRITNARVFTVIQLNTEDIDCLKAQMKQVHRYLTDVLDVSRLIECEGGTDERDSIIEDLRERVKWDKELQDIKVDENNLYKGD